MKQKCLRGLLLLLLALTLVGCARKTSDSPGSTQSAPDTTGFVQSQTETSISINDFTLGEEVPKKFLDREYLVMDAPFLYSCDYVGYDVDADNTLDYICFSRLEKIDGTTIVDLDDVNLTYNGERLETLDDLIDCFGENYEDGDDSFTYENDEFTVYVSIRNDEFSGIVIEAK